MAQSLPQQASQLINSIRMETAENSITPERIADCLQSILDAALQAAEDADATGRGADSCASEALDKASAAMSEISKLTIMVQNLGSRVSNLES